jgi:hypothetical protein
MKKDCSKCDCFNMVKALEQVMLTDKQKWDGKNRRKKERRKR